MFLVHNAPKKLNKSLLAKYKEWVTDNGRRENVQDLRELEFIDRESELLTTASEIITGIQKSSAKQEKPMSRGRTDGPTISYSQRLDVRAHAIFLFPR